MSVHHQSTLRCMCMSVSTTAVLDQCMWHSCGRTVSGMHPCLHQMSPKHHTAIYRPEHVSPSPKYPALHVHVRVVDGGARSVHVACEWHDCVKHALMSACHQLKNSHNHMQTSACQSVPRIPCVACTCPCRRRRCQISACGLCMAWLRQARIEDICRTIKFFLLSTTRTLTCSGAKLLPGRTRVLNDRPESVSAHPIIPLTIPIDQQTIFTAVAVAGLSRGPVGEKTVDVSASLRTTSPHKRPFVGLIIGSYPRRSCEHS
jgi:hypothetical protein